MANALASPAAPAAPATTKQGGGQAQLIPFTRASVEYEEPFYDTTFTLSANQQLIPPTPIPAFGFKRGVRIDVVLTSAGNAATVTLTEDAPWSLFAEIATQDVDGAPLWGPAEGYWLYLTHKYFGFRRQQDPKLYPYYQAVITGSGATAGTGRFQFKVPTEINKRTALGSLPNMNDSQRYQIRAVVNNLAGIFGVAPTVAPTARIRMTLEAWDYPEAQNSQGMRQAQVPIGNGTTQFVSRFPFNNNAGSQTVTHNRKGLRLRNLMYIQRRAGTSRVNGDADLLGTAIQWFVDSRLYKNMLYDYNRDDLSDRTAFVSLTAEAAGGPDNGVFALCFCDEFDGTTGFELGDKYLYTTGATRLEMLYIPANAGTLQVGTNDVALKNLGG